MTEGKEHVQTEQDDELRDLDLPSGSAQEITGGKASFSDLSFTKYVNAASPILMSDGGTKKKAQ
jgi:type VI protein secretion system component Hcp